MRKDIKLWNECLNPSKAMKKKCPICKKEKPLSEYYTYYCKERNKHRVSNYCRECAREMGRERAKKHYHDNREQKLKYAQKYRQENKEQIKLYFKKQRERLSDVYLKNKINATLKIKSKDTEKCPELIEAYRTRVLTFRINKKLRENG